MMERLERGLQECLHGWDVIENPYYCNRGLEEIATQQTAPVREVFTQKTRCYGIEHKRLVEREKILKVRIK